MNNGIFIRWNRAMPDRATEAIEHLGVSLQVAGASVDDQIQPRLALLQKWI